MAISLKHPFTSAKSDGLDATLVQPSNWNAEHTLTLAAGKVLGRNTSSDGAVQELPIAVTSDGNVTLGQAADRTPDGSWSGQLTVSGNGYSGGISLNATGMWLGHTSPARALIFATDETERGRFTDAGVFSLKSAGGGQFALAPASSASSFTLTLPARTGTLATQGPLASAYNNTTQSISATTLTKVSFQTETVDTDGNFASSTFTPTTPGYYFINALIYIDGTATESQGLIYKNGSVLIAGAYCTGVGADVSGVFYCNGSTDYIEIYVFLAAARTLASESCFFNAFFLRA